MLINRFEWIKIGISPTSLNLILPPCSGDSGTVDSEYFVDGGRNANGIFIGTEIGRMIDKQQVKFDILPAEKWWEIQNWFENHSKTFYAEFFNYRLGRKMVRKFYLGNVSGQPAQVDSRTGIPKYMKNCVMNIIDVGE